MLNLCKVELFCSTVINQFDDAVEDCASIIHKCSQVERVVSEHGSTKEVDVASNHLLIQFPLEIVAKFTRNAKLELEFLELSLRIICLGDATFGRHQSQRLL